MKKSFGVSLAFSTMLLAALPAGPVPAQQTEHRDRARDEAACKTTTADGELVFRENCQACHMSDGKGATGAAAFPALAHNPRLVATAYPIMIVLRGKGAMPEFTRYLDAAQIAAVVGYIRTHLDNNYPDPVMETEVVKMNMTLSPR